MEVEENNKYEQTKRWVLLLLQFTWLDTFLYWPEVVILGAMMLQ